MKVTRDDAANASSLPKDRVHLADYEARHFL